MTHPPVSTGESGEAAAYLAACLLSVNLDATVIGRDREDSAPSRRRDIDGFRAHDHGYVRSAEYGPRSSSGRVGELHGSPLATIVSDISVRRLAGAASAPVQA